MLSNSRESLEYVLERSPRTKLVVFRKYYSLDAQRAWLDSGDGTKLATEVFDEYASCLAECHKRGITAYLEDLNEMEWNPWTEMPDKQARLSMRFAERCKVLGVKPAILSIAVGNPPGSMEERAWLWNKLYPALYAAKEAGGALSRHSYGAPRFWKPDPKFYALRHRDDRAMWPADLQSLPELHSEIGIDGGIIGAASAAVAGWRTYVDVDQYINDLEWFDGEISEDDYVLAGFIFTAGNTDMWHNFDVTHEPKIQRWLREQEGGSVAIPIPTKITPVNQPEGQPGGTAILTFTAEGIDGAANGFVGFEYPLVPGTEQTYYGGASQHEIGEFTNGTWDAVVDITMNTTPLPPEGVTGFLFVQILELDGTPVDPVIDGGRFDGGTITVTEAPVAGTGPAPMSRDEQRCLDDLWALAAAFDVNHDPSNAEFIRERVIRIKHAHGMP